MKALLGTLTASLRPSVRALGTVALYGLGLCAQAAPVVAWKLGLI